MSQAGLVVCRKLILPAVTVSQYRVKYRVKYKLASDGNTPENLDILRM